MIPKNRKKKLPKAKLIPIERGRILLKPYLGKRLRGANFICAGTLAIFASRTAPCSSKSAQQITPPPFPTVTPKKEPL